MTKAKLCTQFYLAACYHSSQLMASLHQIARVTDVNIKGWTFSETQAGKSSADRQAAIVKNMVRKYVSFHGDADTPLHFYEAMTSDKMAPPSGFHFYYCKSKTVVSSKMHIAGISEYHDFLVRRDGLVANHYHGIGNGHLIPLKQLIAIDAHLDVLHEKINHPSLSDKDQCRDVPGGQQCDTAVEHDAGAEEDDRPTTISRAEVALQRAVDANKFLADGSPEAKELEEKALFDCPEEHCTRQYMTERGLISHIIRGDHYPGSPKDTFHDYVVKRWSTVVEENVNTYRTLPMVQDQMRIEALAGPQDTNWENGWARHSPRKSAPLPKRSLAYLDELFDEGMKKGVKKLSPQEVREKMLNKKNDKGRHYFDRSEVLMPTQIQSYFSRRAAKMKAAKSARFRRHIDTTSEEFRNQLQGILKYHVFQNDFPLQNPSGQTCPTARATTTCTEPQRCGWSSRTTSCASRSSTTCRTKWNRM
jgi:hypothetical protein